MNRPKSDTEKLNSLLDALEESILKTSGAEIIEEIRQEGKDPEAAANDVQQLIAAQIKQHRRKKLREAQEGYQKAAAASSRRPVAIPDSPAERRLLVASVLSRRPDVPTEITVSWREGRYASDDDVASLLEDLADLGFLEEDS
jgi:hypothetical protein